MISKIGWASGKVLRTVLVTLLFLVLSHHSLRAQTQASSASFSGTIADQAGARIPNAKVILSSPEKGISRVFTTDASGNFSFRIVPPGNYDLTVEAGGFKTYHQQGFALEVGQDAAQSIALEVGSAQEQVTVSAEAPILNTDNANVAAEISGKQVVELPLNLRNVFGLVTLNSSVNNGSQGQVVNGGGEQGTADQDISFFNFGGGFFGSSAFLLDGAWDTADGWGGVVYVPSVDAVQEFKIQTNSFTAQYGWSTGNVINVVTKTGTRSLHGDVYEFFRNDALDANGYFNNYSGLPRAALHRNQFGASLGGPVYLPHVYRQRDKTFFFVLYEGLRQSNPATALDTVPTAAFRSGDLSALLGPRIGTDALGRPILSGQIYNPFSTRQIGTSASGTPIYIRDPIPGNNLSGFIDPVAKNILAYWPNPTNGALANNFAASASAPTNSNEFTVRIDHNLNDAARLYGRFSIKHEQKQVSAPLYGANNPGGPGQFNPDNRYNVALGYSQVLSPTLTGSANFGFARWVEGNNVQSAGFKASSLGLPAAIDANSPQFPVIGVQGESGLGPQAGAGEGKFPNNIGSFSVDVTKTHGNHTLSMGYMGVLSQILGGRVAPTPFNFDAGFTSGPDPNAPSSSTGYGFGSFLIGTAASGSTGITSFPATSKIYNGVYLQDDWKAVPKLTLNLGIRYEIQGAPTERHNAQAYFDFNAVNPISSAVGGKYLGQFVYNGNGHGSGLYNTSYANIAPRFGFAYQAHPDFVVRGGFGIFYPTTFYGNGPNPGYSQTTSFVSSLNGGLNPSSTLSNPFPAGILPLTGNSLGGLIDVGQSITVVDHIRPSPYVEQWMFGLQYSPRPSDVIDITYVGNHGLKMVLGGANRNQLPPQYLSQTTQLNSPVTNPFYGHVPGSGCGLSNPTVSSFQLLLPYAQYCDSISNSQAPVGFSNYNALQATYTHRVTAGLNVLASYTFSKFIDNVDGSTDWALATSSTVRNYYNLAAERSVDADDIPHSLVVSYIYELPVGTGKKFGSHMNRAVDAAIGGWQVSGISTFKSGFPLSIGANNFSSTLYGGNQHANVVGDPNNIAHRGIHQWFNTAAFQQAAPYTFGDAPRYLSNLRAPGYDNWDLGIQKWFRISEQFRLQFRGEMFNAFNHANFYAPNTTLSAGSYGTITAANPPRDVQLALKLYW
jgi:Carboxypeptidase regulatory-like domain